MKFTVERDHFADAVAWASRSAATRPLTPYLLGILIEVDSDEVTFSGYDLEVSGKASVTADVSEKGRALVPGRLLTEISRALPARPVNITLEGTKVHVMCGAAKFSLPTLPMTEYPSLPEVPEAAGVITGSIFATAVAQVAIAAGRDDSLPVLTGIHVEIERDHMTLVATDRYRLAVRELTWQNEQPDATAAALIRARTLNDAAKAMAGSSSVTIGLSPQNSPEQRVGFASVGRTMTSRMLDGTFPPYRHLLPTDVSTTAVVESSVLLDAVRRVALVTEKTIPLRLHIKGNTLVLEAGGGEEAQASEEMEITVDGDPITIAFNAAYLADGLNAVNMPFVQISFTAASKPAILTGKQSVDGDPDMSYRYLLMPMRY